MPESCLLFSNLSRNFSPKYVSSPFSSMLLKLSLLNYHCARANSLYPCLYAKVPNSLVTIAYQSFPCCR